MVYDNNNWHYWLCKNISGEALGNSVSPEQRAFTLVEVLIVAGIISIGLLMMARLFPLGLRAKQSAEQYSIAGLLGQQLMEKIKGRGYNALGADYPSKSLHYGTGEENFKMHRGYRWRVEWWDTKTPNLRKVRVTIFYGDLKITDKGTSQPHLELVTYLAKRD